MRGISERDRQLARLTRAHSAAVRERALRRAEDELAGVPDPVRGAEGVFIAWLALCPQRLALGQVDEAAEAWLRSRDWALRAHWLYVEAGRTSEAAAMVHSALAAAIVAGDQDGVAELLAPYQGGHSSPWVWGRVLVALAAGDDTAIRAAAEGYERKVPEDRASKLRALPRLGAAAIALLEADADAFNRHLEVILTARETAVKRGYLRGHLGLCVEAATLWRLACDLGLEVGVDDRFRAVRMRFLVTSELEFEGANVRGQPFYALVDLLPTHLYGRVLALGT